jgi:rhodanese-related sulfurtransferase
MNKKSAFYYLLIILCFSNLQVEAQIKNQEYKLMLDSLYEHSVALITIEEFKKLNKQSIYLLDTREEEEFSVSRIKNARNVGYFWFDMRKVYDIPKDSKIILYCSVGYRSEKIAHKLFEAGYKNVFNLYGGIFEWVNQGNPIYTKNGVQTSEIHTYDKEWARWVNRGTKVN